MLPLGITRARRRIRYKRRKTPRNIIFFNGSCSSDVWYPLVNVYITNWKDPPCYSWENPLFLWAMFNIKLLILPEGNTPEIIHTLHQVYFAAKMNLILALFSTELSFWLFPWSFNDRIVRVDSGSSFVDSEIFPCVDSYVFGCFPMKPWCLLMVLIPSGNLTVCYWKWQFIVDFPIKNGDFP